MSEVIPAVSTPTADAPPPAAPVAPVTEAAPVVEAPAVETPSETGNWLVELALKEGQESSAEKTPLPAEASPGSEAKEPPAPATTPADTTEAAPPLDAKPEDEELTPEEQELVKSRPEAEQPELGRRLRTARFMSRYKDPENPVVGIREHLEQQSPSRYAELQYAVIEHALQDPAKFADLVYQKNPELYGKYALETVNADPEFFIQHLSGKKLDVQSLRAAVEQFDPTKPVATPATLPPGVLTPEEMEDVRLYLGEEIAEKLEKAAVPVKAEPPPPDPAQQKAVFEQMRQVEAEADRVFSSGVKVVDDYAAKYADDGKTGLGLKVSEEERKLAPEVALLKDFKRMLFFSGLGDGLPAFEKGFGEWGKDSPEFNKLLGQAWHYAEKREEANTQEAARALLPYVDKYIREARMKHPLFAVLDNAIKRLAAQTNPKVPNDAIIPGAPANSQPQASEPQRRIANYLLADALSVK